VAAVSTMALDAELAVEAIEVDPVIETVETEVACNRNSGRSGSRSKPTGKPRRRRGTRLNYLTCIFST
jgi:hypothetical protein